MVTYYLDAAGWTIAAKELDAGEPEPGGASQPDKECRSIGGYHSIFE